MGRHRRSAAGRAATGRATGATHTQSSGAGSEGPQHSSAGPRPVPMGTAPYLNPEAYAEATAKAQAFLFETGADATRATPGSGGGFGGDGSGDGFGGDFGGDGSAGGGSGPDGEPSHGPRRRTAAARPVRTGLLGVSVAVALGTIAVATGVVPGLESYRLGGGSHTAGRDHVQTAAAPGNTASAQGGSSGSADAGDSGRVDGRTGNSTGGGTERSGSPRPSASASASPSKPASPKPAPSRKAAEKPAPSRKAAEKPAPRTTPSKRWSAPTRPTPTARPAEPAATAKPNRPAKPSAPAASAKPPVPPASAKPSRSPAPSTSAEPSAPATSAKPSAPSTPAKPSTPSTPGRPSASSAPAKPAAPAKSAKPKPSPSRTATKAPSVSSPPVTVSQEAAIGAEVLTLVNNERAKAGCSPLAANSSLTGLAGALSDDMAARSFFDHTDPDGRTPWDRAAKAGITGLGGENIARGQGDAAAVMTAWMNDPEHRANILNCGFKTLGVGVHFGSGGPLWTQDFGY
ncbi:CAP domain-containing protein [Streptomyces sp. SP2-10]|uniref:CAP domain-containing protein n=1 Tax=Streptomyces sp. SP2-10 TaxID=2873385 RepID=UPI001CA70363|nr:CAP domain-containing protein [Streptomyces sp. SP2-10]MBY8841525.1 hypothetical protein [Streptomyces sp. SP2-10]